MLYVKPVLLTDMNSANEHVQFTPRPAVASPWCKDAAKEGRNCAVSEPCIASWGGGVQHRQWD